MRIELLTATLLVSSFAWTSDSAAAQRVRSYQRKNGTYVGSHFRSNSDGRFYNNWSAKGQMNPFNGRKGAKGTKK